MVVFWLKVRLFLYLVGAPALVVAPLLCREFLRRAIARWRKRNS